MPPRASPAYRKSTTNQTFLWKKLQHNVHEHIHKRRLVSTTTWISVLHDRLAELLMMHRWTRGPIRVGHGSLFQNPTQPTISGPNPTHKSSPDGPDPTQPNQSLTLSMALGYTENCVQQLLHVTDKYTVRSSQLEWKSRGFPHSAPTSVVQVSTKPNPTHQKLKKLWPNPTQLMDGPNPWPTLGPMRNAMPNFVAHHLTRCGPMASGYFISSYNRRASPLLCNKWNSPQGGQVHYIDAAARASNDRERCSAL